LSRSTMVEPSGYTSVLPSGWRIKPPSTWPPNPMTDCKFKGSAMMSSNVQPLAFPQPFSYPLFVHHTFRSAHHAWHYCLPMRDHSTYRRYFHECTTHRKFPRFYYSASMHQTMRFDGSPTGLTLGFDCRVQACDLRGAGPPYVIIVLHHRTTASNDSGGKWRGSLRSLGTALGMVVWCGAVVWRSSVRQTLSS
jgi:hypothetical protein